MEFNIINEESKFKLGNILSVFKIPESDLGRSIIIVKNKFTEIGSIRKDKRKVNNKKTIYQNVREVYNGDRNR